MQSGLTNQREQRTIKGDEPQLLMPHCGRCGYDLRGLPLARCPECGFGNTLPNLRHVAETWFLSWRGALGLGMPPWGALLIDSPDCAAASRSRRRICGYGHSILILLAAFLLILEVPDAVGICLIAGVAFTGLSYMARVAGHLTLKDFNWRTDLGMHPECARRAFENIRSAFAINNWFPPIALALLLILRGARGTALEQLADAALLAGVGGILLHPLVLCILLSPSRPKRAGAEFLGFVSDCAVHYIGHFIWIGFCAAAALLAIGSVCQVVSSP